MWLAKNGFNVKNFYNTITHQFYVDVIENKDYNLLFNQSYNTEGIILPFPNQLLLNRRPKSLHITKLVGNYLVLWEEAFNNYRPLNKQEVKTLGLPKINAHHLESIFNFQTVDGKLVTLVYPDGQIIKKYQYLVDETEITFEEIDSKYHNVLRLIQGDEIRF